MRGAVATSSVSDGAFVIVHHASVDVINDHVYSARTMTHAHDLHIFSTPELADFVGIPLDVQRNWRRRGILPRVDQPGFCVQDKRGHWHFSYNGALAMWAILRMSKSGLDQVIAAYIVGRFWNEMEALMAYAVDNQGALSPDMSRYVIAAQPVTVQPDDDLSGMFMGYRVFKAREIARDATAAYPIMHVIDLWGIAHGFAEALKDLPAEKVAQITALVEGAMPDA